MFFKALFTPDSLADEIHFLEKGERAAIGPP